MPHGPSIEPVLRWTREVLSDHRAQGVVPVLGPGDSAIRRAPISLPGCEGPFHFTQRMSRFCKDVCKRVPELSHIDMSEVLVTFLRCRSRRTWGLQARLVPLRFRGGEATQVRSGWRYKAQKVYVGQVEMKYVLSFYLPRFLDQTFDEKLITVFHELYHISAAFDGDIRRFGVADHVHGGSQREYDKQMASLARKYLRTKPSPASYDFLRLSFDELEQFFGEIVGLQVPTPKLIPIEKVT